MCGIVGYIGPRQAASLLLEGLRRLEYRGYDSSGIAVVNGHGLEIRKAAGKLSMLEQELADGMPGGTLGIGHTRWATHGRPTDANAHPHVDCQSTLAVVHNGIIENYRELRRTLAADGHRFRSQTDTEVIAHLIERHLTNDLADAVRRAARDLHGAYAVACISADAPGTLVAFRRGSSPLVVGCGQGEMFIASDVPALLGKTHEVLVLEDGDLVVLTANGISVSSLPGTNASSDPARRHTARCGTPVATDGLTCCERGSAEPRRRNPYRSSNSYASPVDSA